MSKPAFSRVILKLSGEALTGDQEYGIDPKFISFIAREIKKSCRPDWS